MSFEDNNIFIRLILMKVMLIRKNLIYSREYEDGRCEVKGSAVTYINDPQDRIDEWIGEHSLGYVSWERGIASLLDTGKGMCAIQSSTSEKKPKYRDGEKVEYERRLEIRTSSLRPDAITDELERRGFSREQ